MTEVIEIYFPFFGHKDLPINWKSVVIGDLRCRFFNTIKMSARCYPPINFPIPSNVFQNI